MMMKKIGPFLLIIIVSLTYSIANASDYYMATNGSDSNTGLAPDSSHAWLTLNKACSTLSAGDTVYIRGGTYTGALNRNQKPGSGSPGLPITFKNYPGESPLFDGEDQIGTGPGDSYANSGIFNIQTQHDIVIDGIKMTRGSGYACIIIGSSSPNPNNITVQNCEIYNQQWTDTCSGIMIYTSTNVLIKNNYIHDMTRGANGIELFVWGGDVSISIENNDIKLDNSVRKGIYIKHGNSVQGDNYIKNNKIWNAHIGISCNGQYWNITNNLIYDSDLGMRIYEAAGHNYGNNNIFQHNTIVDCSNATEIQYPSGGESWGAKYNTIKDNLIYNSGKCVALWEYYSGGDTHQTSLDHNLYYSMNVKEYGTTYTSLSSWQAHYSDIGSIDNAPTFVDYSGDDFALASGSAGENAASDGEDMGADVSLVGVQGGHTPSNPTGLHDVDQ